MTGSPELGRIPLGGTGWRFWSECELRTAGLPARRVLMLANEDLAESARRPGAPGDDFAAHYARAQERESAALAALCREPLFTEMVAWQNPDMVHNCLVPLGQAHPARPAVRRRRDLKVASYLQRYAVKNDTIGFFGPTGWARWDLDAPAVTLRCGPGLIATRQVFFEQWAADALAGAVADDPAVRPWLRPRRPAADAWQDGTVRRPRGRPVPLDAAECEVYRRCDGATTIAELRTLLPGYPVDRIVDALHSAGLLTLDPPVPFHDEPQQRLRAELAGIDDVELRERLQGGIDELTTARDMVASAAGKPAELLDALSQLDTVFQRVTGQDANRRAGQTYAGRRLVYEDAVRDLETVFGAPLLDALSRPLALVLDSARWFVGAVAAAYRVRFTELFEQCRAAAPDGVVSLARLVSLALPDLMCTMDQLPPPVADTVGELQRRWGRLLAVPTGARRHTVSATDLAPLAAQLFPATAPPWSSAVHHCPDIMLAATGADDILAGRYQFVLGELHLATNTLDCRVTTALHPRAGQLLRADAEDRGGHRIVPVPSRDSPAVTSRTYPPAFLLPGYTYWTTQYRDTGAPGPILSGAALTVVAGPAGLRVRTPDGAGDWDLLEVLGDHLSAAVMNAFQPVPVTAHRPRIGIDRLVLCRESWRFPASTVDWTRGADPVARYRAAQHWRERHRLPQRVFFRVGTELKPVYLDFTSVTLVNLCAATVRAAVTEDPDTTLSLSELLPDLTQTWVPDAAGETYTSEIRLVVVDPSAPAPAHRLVAHPPVPPEEEPR